MHSQVPKVLTQVLFKPMLGWVIEATKKSGIENICVVKGFRHEDVQNYLNSLDLKCETVLQLERKGTAHAVMMAKPFLDDFKDNDVLILGGDSPFIDKKTIVNSYKVHKNQGNSATIISSKLENPFGYGRIVRDTVKKSVSCIVEERDASDEQRKIKEINSGAYWFKIDSLLSNLFEISSNTSQNEYYLTSIIKLLLNQGLKVNAFEAASPDIVLGANDPLQLEQLNIIARNRIIDKLIKNGVNIPCRDGIIVGSDAVIHKGATILPNTLILGKSTIHENAIIGPNSQIIDSQIGRHAIINSSYCKNMIISDNKILKLFTFLDGSNQEFMI